MSRQKTILSGEEQWEQTVAYATGTVWHRKSILSSNRRLFVFSGSHRLALAGDILFLTMFTGALRWGATGVTSKGARLNCLFLPAGFSSKEYVELPDDFIGMQWNDPVVGRFVADLRASHRSQVSADSLATSRNTLLPGIDTSKINYHGLYKSVRLARERKLLGRRYDHRYYLRFYPNGTVIWAYDVNHRGWPICEHPKEMQYRNDRDQPSGHVRFENDNISFELSSLRGPFARFKGQFQNGNLLLSRSNPEGKLDHEEISFRFHPFNPESQF